MHYQKRFDKIIDECFGLDEAITYIKVKELYINRHGTRYLPHGHKISLMLKGSDKVYQAGTDNEVLVYWRKRT